MQPFSDEIFIHTLSFSKTNYINLQNYLFFNIFVSKTIGIECKYILGPMRSTECISAVEPAPSGEWIVTSPEFACHLKQTKKLLTIHWQLSR